MKSHITVMKDEAIKGLQIRPGNTIVDATFGSGGHAREILTALGTGGRLIGIDVDETALSGHSKLQERYKNQLLLCVGDFRNIKEICTQVGVLKVNAILADLGWRMDQITDGGKGFSFSSDDPLLMTYGNPSTYTFTARDIVNDWDEEHIVDILSGYGEERFSKKIAKAIIEKRIKHPIETAASLAQLIEDAVPAFYRRGRIHPATKTFQALRIAVNDELGALRTFITNGFTLLKPKGRVVIITFHSLEDRIVKQMFKGLVGEGEALQVTKKPIVPTSEEIKNNPRSRSAKLRIIEKT